jgi:hypothetical protein
MAPCNGMRRDPPDINQQVTDTVRHRAGPPGMTVARPYLERRLRRDRQTRTHRLAGG